MQKFKNRYENIVSYKMSFGYRQYFMIDAENYYVWL